ncbi:homocysteine biosynthesis protein [Fervidobacterium thailandense]|uniref:homocysteine biosynthesis protein n=1 Tax=Fervidobacterium thailandense TaxID=1008305 RepID=UPI000845BF18|nr:homocysteine biosynthesis protein [Fervidobacterium thailandense]
MVRTIDEINEKIANGEAVVLTAEEFIKMCKEEGVKSAFKKVDVVTTGTFAPMCSSGAFINFGHTVPPMRMERIKLAGVPVYGGIAAVDGYLGATAESEEDPTFGGGHVIELLIRGEKLLLQAWGKGTDCYPRRYYEGLVDKHSINDFYLFNPRNAYQNYSAATNGSDRILYTYMGKLLPNYGNVTFSTSGELSPLLKDPKLRTIGVGTRIFLGGTIGYVAWYGTQFRTNVKEDENGVPMVPARTLALIGDAKKMSAEYVRGAYFKNYGVTLFVGVGVPIPVLDEEIAFYLSLSNRELKTEIRDYSRPEKPLIRVVTYSELFSGEVELFGKLVRTSPLSSLSKAREIANTLKEWVEKGRFYLTKPVEMLNEERALLTRPNDDLDILQNLEIDLEIERLKSSLHNECVGCGACISVCNFGALRFNETGKVTVIRNLCTGCRLCEDVCPIGLPLPEVEVLQVKRLEVNECNEGTCCK